MTVPTIIYQDDALIVINKPSGLPVHSRNGGVSLEQYLPEFSFGYNSPPKLAHRLDRDTSGCMILGRTKEAISRLGKMFVAGRILKTYCANVHGYISNKEGTIDISLRKQSLLRHQWRMEADISGKPSITNYKVLGYNCGSPGCVDCGSALSLDNSGQVAAFSPGQCMKPIVHTFLQLYPKTGRTHQLRVHCKAIGHPIVGDKVYGNENDDDDSAALHLHASELTIPFHQNSPAIKVSAPLPTHMLKFMNNVS